MLKCVLFFLIFTTSCALKVDYRIPTQRFIDPETRGVNVLKEPSGYFFLHGNTAQRLVLSSVSTLFVFDTPVSDEQAFENSFALGLQGGVGIVDFFDLHYRAEYDSPDMVIAKFQVLGTHAKEATRGHKIALWGGMGSMNDSSSLSVSNSDGTTTRTYQGDLSVKAWEVGLSYGFRYNPTFLAYLNFVHARYNAHSTLTSISNPTVIVQGMTNQNAVNLGLKFGKPRGVFGQLEAGYSHVEWREKSPINDYMASIGGTLGYGF